MRDKGFAAEFDRQRSEIVQAAFGIIAQNIEKAVSTPVGLPDSKDERVKHLTANDIISHYLKHKKLKDLKERIQGIETQSTRVLSEAELRELLQEKVIPCEDAIAK